MKTLNHPPRRLTNGYPIIDLNRRWHFTITLNLSDRRHSNSDHPAPTQLYRGNLPHYHRPSRLVQPVRTLTVPGGPITYTPVMLIEIHPPQLKLREVPIWRSLPWKAEGEPSLSARVSAPPLLIVLVLELVLVLDIFHSRPLP